MTRLERIDAFAFISRFMMAMTKYFDVVPRVMRLHDPFHHAVTNANNRPYVFVNPRVSLNPYRLDAYDYESPFTQSSPD